MALNKINPTAIIKVCSTLDGAIDIEAMGDKAWEKYQDTYDFDLLKFKEGEVPTILLVKNILSSEEAKIKQDHLKIEFPELANASADTLKNIDLKSVKPIVKQVDSQEMIIKYFNYGISHYEEGKDKFECNANVFPYNIVQEIGAFILTRTQLGDNLKNA